MQQFFPYYRTTLVAVLCLLIPLAGTSQSAARMIKEADAYFEHEMFRAALQYYKQGGNPQTWDKDTKLKVAICRYEVNDNDGAIALLKLLVDEGRTDPEVFFYLGRAYQHRAMYRQAATQLKEYVRRTKPDDLRRAWVKDEIVRCAKANNLKYGDQIAYVENLGTAVNTFNDEFAPVPSPSIMDRLYFTSARPGNAGGMMTADGQSAGKFGGYRNDMFYSEHNNGVWRTATAMDRALNSRQDEHLSGFSDDGQKLYFVRATTPDRQQVVIDTFAEETSRMGTFDKLGDFNPSSGDRDLFMFNDTIMLFASDRPGGFGGYDLYYCINRYGRWRSAVNLGPKVNSHYDEVTPFLTRNGRVLFFSSDRKTSMGGLDVFRSDFDDIITRWSDPVNLGIPINSAGDESHFRMAVDGLTAYFDSDRKTGYGKRDLYAAYLKEAVRPHLTLSIPVTFAQVRPLENADDIARQNKPQEIREFYIGDLLFEPNDLVLTPQNIKALDVLSNLLLIYPALTVDMICHDIPSGPRSFDLYFSVKKAEQAAQHLIRKGVDPERIYVKGCGSLYPRAKSPDPTLRNPAVDRLNRRIELKIYNTEDQPIKVIYEYRNIPENLQDERGPTFTAMEEKLVYRVQIATVSQMFQHVIFDEYSDAMIHLDPRSKLYRYYVGMETSYRDALAIRDELVSRGFRDAKVVAYIEGRHISREEILDYAGAYPDLLDYLQQF